jgi:hypothetical protein
MMSFACVFVSAITVALAGLQDNSTGVGKRLQYQPDPQLTAKAIKAVDAVLNDSELKELWEENEEDYPKWVAVVNDLKSRIPTVA